MFVPPAMPVIAMAKLSQIKNRQDISHFGVALIDPKNSYNVGGSLRATGAFEGSYFVVQGNRWRGKGADWRHMDTEGAHIRLPTYLGVEDAFRFLPYGAEPVAIELSDNASSLVEFEHPKVAMYCFGPEDGALSSEVRAKCSKTIFVPTEYSLNLYSAVSVVLYDRIAKLSQKKNEVSCPACNSANYRWEIGEFHCNSCGHKWKVLV